MERGQAGAEGFVDLEQVPQIGSGVAGTGRAVAAFLQWPGVVLEPRIPDQKPACPREELLLTFWARPMVRQLQWVAPWGLLCKVASMIAATLSSV